MSEMEIRSSVIDPYNTTIGRFIDTKAIRKELMIYISTLSDKTALSYGLTFQNVVPVVLLGKEGESSIPPIPYPIFAYDNIKREYLVIDLREHVNKAKLKQMLGNNFDSLTTVMTKQENMYLPLRIARVMDSLKDGVNGKLYDIYDQLLNVYVSVFYKMLSRIGEFPIHAYMDFKMSIGVFFYMLLSPIRLTEVKDPGDEFRLLAKRLDIPNHLIKDFLDGVVGGMTIVANNTLEENYRLLKTFFLLFEGDTIFNSSGYSSLVREDLLYQRNNNLWYGIGTKNAPLMALENIPIFIGLIESATLVSSFKRTLFSNMLKDVKSVKMPMLVQEIQRKFSFQ